MIRTTKWLGAVLLILVGVFCMGQSTSLAAQSKGVLEGRVARVEGQVLRYVPDTQNWVALVENAPFGLDDALYSGEKAKAVFIMPNLTRIRIGEDTQIQMIALRTDLTSVDVASGRARFFGDSDRSMIKVSTPFGYAVARGVASFDLTVGGGSVEVTPLKGTLDFVQKSDDARFTLAAGENSLISDGSHTTREEVGADQDWLAWNESRDRDWEQLLAAKSESAEYLPEGLRDQGPVLDANGKWERVRYHGEYRHLWRPTQVGAGYEPYTAGRWTDYHGDNIWMPDEPFGYVTHHYGNWVYLDEPGSWYWMPPVSYSVYVRHPRFEVGFFWFPGRVVWIHSGIHIGWIPLAPYETYYAHRFWGPRTVVVRNVRRVHVRINRFHHFRRAVIIDRKFLYAVHDYRPHRIRSLRSLAIRRHYRAVPFPTRAVLAGFASDRHRHNFRNIEVERLPRHEVRRRILRNRRLALRGEVAERRIVERQLRRARRGRFSRDVRLERPRITTRLTTRKELNRARRQLRQERVQSHRERRRVLRDRRENKRQALQEKRQRRESRRIQRARRNSREQLRRAHAERRSRVHARRERQREIRARQARGRRQERLERQQLRRARHERRERLQQERVERRSRIRARREKRQTLRSEHARSHHFELEHRHRRSAHGFREGGHDQRGHFGRPHRTRR